MLKWMASAYIKKHLYEEKVENRINSGLGKPHCILPLLVSFFSLYPNDRYTIILIQILLKSPETDLMEQLVIFFQRTH
jgi:hypothetical protein